jgi:hypothetical protein
LAAFPSLTHVGKVMLELAGIRKCAGDAAGQVAVAASMPETENRLNQ